MKNRYSKLPYKKIRHWLVLPFLTFMMPMLLLLDINLEIYHQIGFRLCGMKIVKRSNYIKIDRYKLKYLDLAERAWCTYCGYANGLAGYLVEIVGRTEAYWCGIKHEKKNDFHEPKHHKKFADYGDEDSLKKMYQ